MTHHLTTALEVAVPMALADLDTWPVEEREAILARWAADAVDPLCEHGDVLQYGAGPKATRKERVVVAGTFAALARGLVALSHTPGGVAFDGVLWCAQHARWGTTKPWPCAECLAVAA
jgi:hypothetical protein